MVEASPRLAALPAHKVLSDVHISVPSAILSLHSHLLGVRYRGNKEARSGERFGSCRVANTAMQPLGRQWLRPRSVADGNAKDGETSDEKRRNELEKTSKQVATR